MNDINSGLVHETVYKSIDGPWIALLILSIFIFIISIIAIIILFIFWRRYQRFTAYSTKSYSLSNKPIGKRPIPVHIQEPQQIKPYETQRMEVFVSQNNDERIHARYPPPEDIQQVQQFYERTTNAYF